MNIEEVAGYLCPGGPGLTNSELWFNKDLKWCTDVESSWLHHSTHSQQKPIPPDRYSCGKCKTFYSLTGNFDV